MAVNQYAIVAAIGDEQPGAVRERVAGEAERAAAPARIGGILGKIRAIGNRAHHRSFLVGGVGARRGGTASECIVGYRTGQIRLSQGQVRRLRVFSRQAVPHEHAVVTQVRDVEPHTVGCHRNRVEQVVGLCVGIGLRQVGLHKSSEVGLA